MFNIINGPGTFGTIAAFAAAFETDSTNQPSFTIHSKRHGVIKVQLMITDLAHAHTHETASGDFFIFGGYVSNASDWALELLKCKRGSSFTGNYNSRTRKGALRFNSRFSGKIEFAWTEPEAIVDKERNVLSDIPLLRDTFVLPPSIGVYLCWWVPKDEKALTWIGI